MNENKAVTGEGKAPRRTLKARLAKLDARANLLNGLLAQGQLPSSYQKEVREIDKARAGIIRELWPLG